MPSPKVFRIERSSPPAGPHVRAPVPRGETLRSVEPALGQRARSAVRAALVAGTGLRRAADELQAVVSDTARAAHAILAAVEEIDEAADRLRVAGGGAVTSDALDDIAERSLMIIQACDFQDLTGQRIGNVAGLFTDLEARLAAVRSVLDEVDSTAGELVRPRRTNASMLENGPRLQSDDGHLTQGEIDLIFEDDRTG
ncbi:hypothetical protein [uncultured Alsobacter sp.]|uniref:hypothetical protein n=1 Tax=uncultured Alsobacter sp. TaxID=1748258 RepID=UPI0025F4C14B|nr:hypothetical protein [uncultured Alsobacter sp.]